MAAQDFKDDVEEVQQVMAARTDGYLWPRRADMWLGGDALTSRRKPAVGCGAARRSREALASTATPSPRVGPLPCARLSVTVGASATEILDVWWI